MQSSKLSLTQQVTLLLISSICEVKASRNLVAANPHSIMLSLLTAKNTSLLQVVCECAGLFAAPK
jgi:hypothetical protein